MTDAGVIALGAGCRQLQSIDLIGCSKVTDAGVNINCNCYCNH